jgi:hypothetical protein
MKMQHLLAELLDLFQQEQNMTQAFKIFERELNDILQLRLNEELDVSLVISIYDTLRNESVTKYLTPENPRRTRKW